MTGSFSQSYFIFDSQQFKVARKIYFGLDDDDGQVNDADFLDQLAKKDEDKEDDSESHSHSHGHDTDAASDDNEEKEKLIGKKDKSTEQEE